MKIDFVSITFESEVRLQLLQVISVDRFVDKNLIGKYFIVLNGINNEALEIYLADLFRFAKVTNALLGKIVFIHAEKLFHWQPPMSANRAYLMQQIIKINISRIVDKNYYLLLDSKNHFVRNVSYADFFINKKIRTQLREPAYGLIKYLKNSLHVFNIEGGQYISHAMPTITPYLICTNMALELIRHLESIYHKSYEQVFFEDLNQCTEFYLYYSWLIFKDALNIYTNAPGIGVTLYTKYPEDHGLCKNLIKKVRDEECVKVFGLHRNRLAILDNTEKKLIREIWSQAGLTRLINPNYILNSID